MGEDSELRADVKSVVRRHDPDAETLRDLATDLESLAERYETMEDTL